MSSQLHSLTHFSGHQCSDRRNSHLTRWGADPVVEVTFMLQLTVCGLITTRNLERDTNIESVSSHSFLLRASPGSKILLRSGRRYLRKVGRRKVSEWLRPGDQAQGGLYKLRCRLWVCHSSSYQPLQCIFHTGHYFFRCEPYFFFSKMKISIIHKRDFWILSLKSP